MSDSGDSSERDADNAVHNDSSTGGSASANCSSSKKGRRHRDKERKPRKLPEGPGKGRLPPGFRMRLCMAGRPLNLAAIKIHDSFKSNRSNGKYLELLIANNRPIPDRRLSGPDPKKEWIYFKTKEVTKLQCSGIIVLYDKDGYILENVDPIKANHIKSPSDTLLNVLRRLANNKPNGAEFYKVSRYQVELKFAMHYFAHFWSANAIDDILGYYANCFKTRETVNKQRGKPIRPPGQG